MMIKRVPWKGKSNKQKAVFVASMAFTLAATVTVYALDYSIHACGVAVSQCMARTAPLDVYEVYETVGGN